MKYIFMKFVHLGKEKDILWVENKRQRYISFTVKRHLKVTIEIKKKKSQLAPDNEAYLSGFPCFNSSHLCRTRQTSLCGKCYHIFLPFLSLNSHTENVFLYELHFKWTRKLAQLNDPIKEMKLKRNTTYETTPIDH